MSKKKPPQTKASKQSNPSISLRELSRIAGVSPATVSLAMKESPRLSRETKDRIRQIAKEHGYRPNPHLSRILAETVKGRYKKEGGLIYLIITRYNQKNWNSKNPWFLAMLERCRELGYTLEPFWMNDARLTPARANQIMYARGVDGLIIHPPPYSLREGTRLTIPLDWAKFSVVEIDDVITEPILHHVRHDHLSGVWLALQNMEELGYRRIGLCVAPEVDFATHHRWTAGFGYWADTRNLSEGIRKPLLYDGNPKTIRKWVASHRLDAVIGSSFETLQAIRESGLDVPGDIAFAALDMEFSAIKTGSQMDPLACTSDKMSGNSESRTALSIEEKIAGIKQCRLEQYSLAVDMLVALIGRGVRGIPDQSTSWIIEGKWIPGSTCPKRSVSANLDENLERIPPRRMLPKAFQKKSARSKK